MKLRLAVAACLIGACAGPAAPLGAAVVVVANRSKEEVHFTVQPPEGKPQEFKLAAGDLVPIPTAGRVEVRFAAGKDERKFQLQPNSAYFFGDFPSGLNLEEIGFRAKDGNRPAPRRRRGVSPRVTRSARSRSSSSWTRTSRRSSASGKNGCARASRQLPTSSRSTAG